MDRKSCFGERLFRWALGISLLVGFLALPGIVSALTWDAPVVISTSGMRYPRVAAEGNYIHVVYCTNYGDSVYYQRSTDGGDTWETAQWVAGPGANPYYAPQIEVGAGYVHIVWWQVAVNRIFYRRNTDNGDPTAWEPVFEITTDVTRGESPDVAAGGAFVAPGWNKVNVYWISELLHEVYVRQSTNFGESWGAAGVAVTGSTRILDVQTAGSSTSMTYVWVQLAPGSRVQCKYPYGPMGGPVTLWDEPEGTFYSASHAALSSGGGSLILYVARDDNGGPLQKVHTGGMVWSIDYDLGNGSHERPRSAAHDAYPDHGCTIYSRSVGGGQYGLYISTGPGTESLIYNFSDQGNIYDIATSTSGGCCNMHVVADAGGYITYYRYDPPMAFASPQELAGVKDSDAQWGDFDGDGDLDLVICGNTGSAYVTQTYRNASGTLELFPQADLPGIRNESGGGLAWCDYDKDGDLDLAMAGIKSDGGLIARIYDNDGSGSLAWDATQALTGVGHAAVAWGDYDSDGDLDLVVSGHDGTNDLTVLYKNDSTGTLSPDSANTLRNLRAGSADWADWDGDGDQDLLLTGTEGSITRTIFYENDPVGILTDDGNHGLPGVSLSDAAWGDYDADGDLDLALTGTDNVGPTLRLARVYENTGGGVLVQVAHLMNLYRSSCAWGDYDSDGDLDVAFCGTDGGGFYTRVYENSGGGFVAGSFSFHSVRDGSLTWADVDRDGDLDFFLTGADLPDGSARYASLYRQQCGETNNAPSPPTTLSCYGVTWEDIGYGFYLTWSGASDDETPQDGLYYCLRMGTSPGATDVVSGTYGTPLMGNMGQATGAVIRGLSCRSYYCSVRAIDSGLRASAWSEEFLITGASVPPVQPDRVPAACLLEPNFPNPFDMSTSITYSIPHSANAHLAVYDVTGRLVQTLVKCRREPGRYSVVWDGCDHLGRDLPGGVYFCRLTAGDDRVTRKIVLTN